MEFLEILRDKREKKELNRAQVSFAVQQFNEGKVPDYQMSAFMMAILLNGMTAEETMHLTNAIVSSGTTIDLSAIEGVKSDKHSTGGVGDKVTLALGPIVASFGVKFGKISGRGLGFTGGTLDKLESIPGYRIGLPKGDFRDQVAKIGLAVIAQGEQLVPADRKMYALRDVSGTVESIPLIASSIMSKKIVAGAENIFLDVKVGDGAFMKSVKQAKQLGLEMIELGKLMGRKVAVKLTNMDRPLGNTIGNKLEVMEAMATLQGHGPEDFTEAVYEIAADMLIQAGMFQKSKPAKLAIHEKIKSGEVYKKFEQWISAQGGDLEKLKARDFWAPKFNKKVVATGTGTMNITSSIVFGEVSLLLGAGRKVKDAAIDYDAGIVINKKTNSQVKEGDTVFTLYSNKEIDDELVARLQSAYKLEKGKVSTDVILDTIMEK